MIHLQTSRYLGDQIDLAIAAAKSKPWQEESRIAFVQHQMDRAYQVARAIEAAVLHAQSI